MTFDPEALLASLPVIVIREPHAAMPDQLPKWRWRALRPYNGFSSAERIRVWQTERWLVASGKICEPTCCSVCGSTERVARHSEDYSDVSRAVDVCAPCHSAIHLRFWRPSAWQAIITRNSRSGNEWFGLLPNTPFDLADYLRRKALHVGTSQ